VDPAALMPAEVSDLAPEFNSNRRDALVGRPDAQLVENIPEFSPPEAELDPPGRDQFTTALLTHIDRIAGSLKPVMMKAPVSNTSSSASPGSRGPRSTLPRRFDTIPLGTDLAGDLEVFSTNPEHMVDVHDAFAPSGADQIAQPARRGP
jgi:hypothetical protein